MAEIGTITEISVEEDVVTNVRSGTGRQRKVIMVRGTSGATTDTLDLATYVPNVTGIEGPTMETYDEAVAATASTWSNTTITFDGHTGSGRYQGRWIVYI